MTAHPFDRILSPGEASSDVSSSGDESQSRAGNCASFGLKLDRRQALSALIAASGAALAGGRSPLHGQETEASLAAGDLPTYEGRGLYVVSSRLGEVWQGVARERLNVLGPYVPASDDGAATERADQVSPDDRHTPGDAAEPSDPELPPPPPMPTPGEPERSDAIGSGASAARPAGYLAWLTEREARDLAGRKIVSGVTPYVSALKVVAPAAVDARKMAVVALSPNDWEKKPPAETFASPSAVADDLKRALSAISPDFGVLQTANALLVKRGGGEPLDARTVQTILDHPQVAGIRWESVATTLALGEEGGDRATTLALGEEGAPGGGVSPTTRVFGEEGGSGGGNPTTMALGEEGSGGTPSTRALGEEGGVGPGRPPGGPPRTTLRLGEEGGGDATTLALGEEGGGGGPNPRPSPPTPPDSSPRTTLRLGEEGGGGRD